MARVALVTGGTRGIGHAISIALKSAGYRVAASYAGNDAAAQAFQVETGIPVYKFDVASFEASEKAIKEIEKDLGPIDVLVNNAGITRDTMFHKMTKQQWDEVIGTNLNGLFNVTRQVWEELNAALRSLRHRAGADSKGTVLKGKFAFGPSLISKGNECG